MCVGHGCSVNSLLVMESVCQADPTEMCSLGVDLLCRSLGRAVMVSRGLGKPPGKHEPPNEWRQESLTCKHITRTVEKTPLGLGHPPGWMM